MNRLSSYLYTATQHLPSLHGLGCFQISGMLGILSFETTSDFDWSMICCLFVFINLHLISCHPYYAVEPILAFINSLSFTCDGEEKILWLASGFLPHLGLGFGRSSPRSYQGRSNLCVDLGRGRLQVRAPRFFPSYRVIYCRHCDRYRVVHQSKF